LVHARIVEIEHGQLSPAYVKTHFNPATIRQRIFQLCSWFQAKNSGTVSWRGVNCRPIDRALARAGVGIAITLDD